MNLRERLPAFREPAFGRSNNEHRSDKNDDALQDAPEDERVPIPGGLNHGLDWRDRHCCADSISTRNNARAQPAVIGEPLQHVTGAATVYGARADPANRVPDIKSGSGLGVAGANPARAHEDAANADYQSRPQPIDQVSFERHQPSFGEDECCESDLDGG